MYTTSLSKQELVNHVVMSLKFERELLSDMNDDTPHETRARQESRVRALVNLVWELEIVKR